MVDVSKSRIFAFSLVPGAFSKSLIWTICAIYSNHNHFVALCVMILMKSEEGEQRERGRRDRMQMQNKFCNVTVIQNMNTKTFIDIEWPIYKLQVTLKYNIYHNFSEKQNLLNLIDTSSLPCGVLARCRKCFKCFVPGCT